MLSRVSRLAILFFALTALLRAAEASSQLPVEQQVAEAIQSPKLTVVHFWAPWCSNCQAELKSGGWKETLEANPDVNFIFVTVWNDKDGRTELEKYGIGAQKNLTVLLHPNASRKTGEKVRAFMGMDMPWLPTTWIFKGGKLFYNIGYGEMRFPILQQFINDSSEKWEH
jgi:thiol-disulfide isomerase/thioredoxin